MTSPASDDRDRATGDRLPGWLLWLLPFGLVAAALAWETDLGQGLAPRPVPADVPAPKPVEVALLPDYQIDGGLDARRDTAERPLFNPTRRPAPTLPQEGARPRIQRGQFVLAGTAVVDTKSIAFLREVNGNKSRTVRIGETINGMRVAEVRPDRVRLTLGDESEELVLKVAPGPKSTVQPAPAPGAAAPPAPAQPAAQPAAPPGATTAPAAVPSAPTPAGGSLLERRRAARAAAAAAASNEAAAPTGAATGAAPAAGAAAPQAAQPDPGWGSVYERMQRGR